MGRRRTPIRRLQTSVVYYADRRFASFSIFRKIISRQLSKNKNPNNFRLFTIQSKPILTSLMVLGHEKLFGREYVRVLVSNSENDSTVGWMFLGEFLKVICGKPKWIGLLF
jgi:hypothetical protein